MAWIESHQEIAHHPKTRKLARRLNVSIPTAVGHLHCLWHWALSFAQDGNLSKHDVEDVAIGALWDEEPKDLLDGLVAAGFVDETDEGFVLHDWQSYAGKLLDRRRKDAERKASGRGKSNGRAAAPVAPSEGSPADSPEDAVRTEPDLPNQQDQPTPPSTDVDDGPLAEELRSEGFDPADVAVVVRRVDERSRFGEPITDPLAWSRTVLRRLGAARSSSTNGQRARAVIDGVEHEYDQDAERWEPIESSNDA